MLRRNYISTCILIMTCYLLPLIAQDPAIIITYGDSAYNNFENKMALNYYSQVLEMDSVNYEAAWKLARAYVDVGETFSDKNKRKQFYSKAADLARRAVEIDSMGANGHLYLSISLGRVALDAGAKERIRLSKEIKAEVDRALELDSDNDIAWHVLGRWHRKLATLSWIEKKICRIIFRWCS